MVILSTAVFEFFSTVHTLKGCTIVQLVFLQNMVLPIKHISKWKLIRQLKQAHINYDKIHEIKNRLYHNNQVGDKVMLRNNTSYKYETPYKGP